MRQWGRVFPGSELHWAALLLAFSGKSVCLAVQASSDSCTSISGLQSKHAWTAVRILTYGTGGLECWQPQDVRPPLTGLAGYGKSVTQLCCASRSWMSAGMLLDNYLSGIHLVASLSPFLAGVMGIVFRVSPALAWGMAAFLAGWMTSAFTSLLNPSTCTVSVSYPKYPSST